MNCFFTKSKYTHLYWILDLEDEVHSIWDMWISALKIARAMVFPKLGGVGISFPSGPVNLDFFLEVALPVSTSPEKHHPL